MGKGNALPVAAGYLNQAMWDRLLALVRRLVAAYNIPISRVAGHRERPSGRGQGKTCPGFDAAVIRNLLRVPAAGTSVLITAERHLPAGPPPQAQPPAEG